MFANRKIPSTMSTQHPDHAAIPFWHDKAFINTSKEAKETYISFSELGITEYKWDWEGKLVDESVLERLFGEHFEFFQQNPLGQEKFITYRLPNPKVETEFRIGRAFMNLASAASTAKHFGLPTPPLFEVILPMTKTAEELISLHEAYVQLSKLSHPLYRLEDILYNIRVIPLFEDVETIINSDKIVEKYLKMYKKRFKKMPPYIRPYVARSDPALNFGMIPTVLAIKIALSKYHLLSKKIGIPFHPIIGAAVLPFRGGIDPVNIKKFVDEYQGIRTTTIQSAFKYDFDKKDVIKAIKYLDENLSKNKAQIVSEKDEGDIIKIIPIFEKYYRETIEQIAPMINSVSSHLPKRRERVQHVGLFGYSRGVGGVKLPRAIGFTAALYSIGVPPELIGTGRGLLAVKQKGKVALIEKYYKYIKEDLDQAGRYLNIDNLEKLGKNKKAWADILNDIKGIEEVLGIKLGPKTKEDLAHKKLTDKIYKKIIKGDSPTVEITKAALIRKSLG